MAWLVTISDENADHYNSTFVTTKGMTKLLGPWISIITNKLNPKCKTDMVKFEKKFKFTLDKYKVKIFIF